MTGARRPAATHSEPPRDVLDPDPSTSELSDESVFGESDDQRVRRQQRARQLGRRLGVEASIDDTGWLRGGVELQFTKQRDGTLRPRRVHIDHELRDDEVLADGGVIARCDEYNRALQRLRQLAQQLREAVHRGRIALVPGSSITSAHAELAQLDARIGRSQASTMGYGVVRAEVLIREIEFFVRCHSQLMPIVLDAERAASGPAAWLGRALRTGAASAASIVRQALRWLTARSRARAESICQSPSYRPKGT